MKNTLLNKNDVIEKSNQLIFFRENPLGMLELKLLDIYLSKINARDSENCEVVFTKREFEKIIGVKQIRTEVLIKHLKNLYSPIVIDKKMGSKEVYKIIGLFEVCECEIDTVTSHIIIRMKCTPTAKGLFFNLEDIGYIKYRLGNIIKMKSLHSYFLYGYLLNNMFRGTWEVNLDELRKFLHCENDKYYDKYSDLNKKIIKKAITEINALTDIQVSYKSVCAGYNNIIGVEFTVTPTVKINNAFLMEASNNQMEKEYTPDTDIIEYIQTALSCDKPTAKLIKGKADYLKIDDKGIYGFIQYISSRQDIQNKVGYAIKSFSDMAQKRTDNGGNRFNDFDQKDYSKELEELEKLLLDEINLP